MMMTTRRPALTAGSRWPGGDGRWRAHHRREARGRVEEEEGDKPPQSRCHQSSSTATMHRLFR